MTSSFNRYTASGSCLILIHCIFCGSIAWLLFMYLFPSQLLSLLSIKVLHLTLYTHVHTNLGTSPLKLKNAYHVYRLVLGIPTVGIYLLIRYLNSTDVPRIKGLPEVPSVPIFGNLFQLGSYHHAAAQKLAKKYGSPNGQQSEHHYLFPGRRNANHRTPNSAPFSRILSNPPKTFGPASRPP